MRTLRGRLILSHLLPILVILPLMGIALIYLLESHVLLESLSSEAAGEAVLVARLASQDPSVWTRPANAQAFISQTQPVLGATLEILDAQSILMATSNPAHTASIGKLSDAPGLAIARGGKTDQRLFYSQQLSANVVDVIVPVIEPGGKVLGFTRLTHPLSDLVNRFVRLRYLISGVLAAGLILGAALGWLLAVELEQPLARVTQAVTGLASGTRQPPLSEQGPTEVRQLIAAVNSLVARLNGLETSRRRLLANLVHELGRPLGALHSAIQALQGGAAHDEALRQELLTGMDDAVGTLRRLLNDLSRLYDVLIGSLELETQPVAVSEWLPPFLSPWRAAAQSKRLLWEATIPPDLPTLNLDAHRMEQAVGNLVTNAIKYTPPGGRVSVSVGVSPLDQLARQAAAQSEGQSSLPLVNPRAGAPSPDGYGRSPGNASLPSSRAGHASAMEAASGVPYLWIRVADGGPGIAPAEQELIFTAFYRSPTLRRFPQGMGLGLTIARDLVSAHGGLLTLESAPGKGSVFTIWLPLS